MVQLCDHILFVDENGLQHNALVQWIHGTVEDPTINLVHLAADEAKKDTYGRQVEKRTSVQHKNRTTASGMYWVEL